MINVARVGTVYSCNSTYDIYSASINVLRFQFLSCFCRSEMVKVL